MSSAAGPSAVRDDVLVRRENGILIVTINRPQQRNAVNGAVAEGIARALDLLDDDSGLPAALVAWTQDRIAGKPATDSCPAS